MKRPRFLKAATLMLACWAATSVYGQYAFDAFDLDHPAIGYRTNPPADRAALLNRRLQSGEQQLRFEGTTGYLRSLLAALDIPVESQIAVYSKTSLQGAHINPENPRSIFFNDSVAVAWVPGGFIEVAAHDPRQGGIFYSLPQTPAPTPQLFHDDRCLTCHYSTVAQGIPGFFVRSIPTAVDGTTMPWLGNFTTDHRSEIAERWGGWYVTGSNGSTPHLGNALIENRSAQELVPWNAGRNLTTLKGRINTADYLSPYSDIVALLVFDHQARMMNLLTRIGWEARVLAQDRGAATAASVLRNVAIEVVDYLLFVDEAPLDGARGTSGFAEKFAAQGPRDREGRSLRDLDLQHRLMRYPCSYMVYSEAFESLPAEAKEAIYSRMWEVLSGPERWPKYSRLSESDRRAIIEILRDTKGDFPAYFVM
jgi:hypothetical protein